MLKRQADATEQLNPKRCRVEETPEDLLSILEQFVPLVPARLTREYMGLSGYIVQEFKLDFPHGEWSSFDRKLPVSDSHVAFFRRVGAVDRYRLHTSIWDFSSPLEPKSKCEYDFELDKLVIQSDHLFVRDETEIQVYELTGETPIRSIPYPPGTCRRNPEPSLNVIGFLLHKDVILLKMWDSGIRVLDAHDGKQVRTLSLPGDVRELVSLEGRLYLPHLETARIHEISDLDGSCLQTIQLEHNSNEGRLHGITVVGALHDELCVHFAVATKQSPVGNIHLHAYSQSTGRFLRSIKQGIKSMAFFPHGYALVWLTGDDLLIMD